MTVGKFYREWIERKKPPFVRPALERDYRQQFNQYILPKYADTKLRDVDLTLLEDFRIYLNKEGGLSQKSCRNIIDGTFRIMYRDARKRPQSGQDKGNRGKRRQVVGNSGKERWSGRLDLNQRLHGPEPCALPS